MKVLIKIDILEQKKNETKEKEEKDEKIEIYNEIQPKIIDETSEWREQKLNVQDFLFERKKIAKIIRIEKALNLIKYLFNKKNKYDFL